MIKTIAIVNQKGGCGKTTVAINLAACLAIHGRRTLLVDMDPQGHCALGLAVPEDQIEASMYDVLSPNDKNPVELSRIVWQIGKNFDMAPATIELAALEQELSGHDRRELKLKDAIQTLRNNYDYCIIDCPPSVGLLTFNALIAANAVIVPVETGFFSLHGLAKQLETIDLLKQQYDHDILVRIVPNLYDVRTKLGREMLAEIRKRFDAIMLRNYINFNTKLKESASLGQAINEYDAASTGCRDFEQVSREIIDTLEPAIDELAREAQVAEPLGMEQVIDDTEIIELAEAVEPISICDEDLIAKADELAQKAQGLLAESAEVLGNEPAQNEQASIQQKIEMIYGPSVTPAGVSFAVNCPQADRIAVAGDFNNWSSDATPLDHVRGRNGDWQVVLPLEPGRYRYRIVVDGVWQEDPNNDYVESNPYGELNSVVEVE